MNDPRLGAYNIADLRRMAQKNLPRPLFEYIDRGAEDEVSLRANRAAFETIKFEPRTLVDVSKRSQAISLFGQPSSMPVIMGPTGCGGLCAYQGEALLAKAAVKAGVPFSVSAASLTPMEKVVEQAGGGTLWFQLYMWPDRGLCHSLVNRVKAAGFQALIVTCDGAVPGNREFNLRNGFNTPFRLTRHNAIDLFHPRWLSKVILPYFAKQGGMPHHDHYPKEMGQRVTSGMTEAGKKKTKTDCLSWDDLRELRKIWPHPLIVKGLLSPRDAKLAADCGADGIIVSNHGGRMLDGSVPPIKALPGIVDAVGNRLTVIVDSGFRRGSDVVKALALGAKAVAIGRAPLYGLSAAGEPGVTRALNIFREEIDRVMALLGCTNISEVTKDVLFKDDGLATFK